MVAIRPQDVDGWLSSPPAGTRMVLIHGPDRGLVSERARNFAKAVQPDLDDPFAVVRIDGSTLDADPGRLADEALTVSMFGGQRLIWVRGPGGTKGVADAFKSLASEPLSDAIVLVEAGELKKGAALRTVFENMAGVAAIACYPDARRDLSQIIDQIAKSERLRIAPDAVELLITSLGGDRLGSRQEIEKLAIYCAGKGTVEVQHVIDIVGDVATLSMDVLVDAAFAGDRATVEREYSRLAAQGNASAPVLLSAARQAANLLAMRSAMEKSGLSASEAVAMARPLIFFARKAAVEALLRRWSVERIDHAAERIQSAILQTRRQAALADAITSRTLIALGSTQTKR